MSPLPLQVFLAAPALVSAFRPSPSPGCARSAASHEVWLPHSLHERRLQVSDFEPVQRTYWIQVAGRSAQAASPAPLLLAFHGQTDTADNFAESHNFTHIGMEHGLMAAYPQGMNDSFPGEEQGTGWNVGSAGAAGNMTCVLEGVGDAYGCYRSCRKLKKCGRCNWSTCYDDVLFVRKLLEAVAQDFCIDMARVYLQGESNGAMFVQHVAREMPEVFAGVAPWFGTPMVGFLLGHQSQLIRSRAAASQVAYLSLHGRNDTTIPPGGGETDGGWIYEPQIQAVGVWAAIHGCKLRASPIRTPWDGGVLNFACEEHLLCSSGRRVIQCMYNGVHGDWPSNMDGDEATLWFLLQFSRDDDAGTRMRPEGILI